MRAFLATRWPADTHRYIGSSSSGWRSIAGSEIGAKPASTVSAMSHSPDFRQSRPSSGSRGASVTSTPGWRSRKRAIARGAIVAPAVGKETSRSRPPRMPAIASNSASASASRARITSAWATSARPASVRCTPRALRSTSTVPASRSRAAICWETADCV